MQVHAKEMTAMMAKEGTSIEKRRRYAKEFP